MKRITETANGHATAPADAEHLTADCPPAEEGLTATLRALVVELRRQRGPEPELLTARQAAALCGVSPASWHRLTSAAKTPSSVKLSGAVRWRRSELLSWIGAGCPDRRTWISLLKAGGGAP